MKKIMKISTFILLCLCLVGCGGRGLNYDPNLGLDFSKVKTNEVVFYVYHSNTENHNWEQIASFIIEPKNKRCYDIGLVVEPGKIEISCNENQEIKENNSVTYDSKTLGFTEAYIDEIEGNISSSKSFGVENISGEQLYQLYPITNGTEASFFEDVSPDKPYDEEGDNLDNILITVEIK